MVKPVTYTHMIPRTLVTEEQRKVVDNVREDLELELQREVSVAEALRYVVDSYGGGHDR